MYPLVVSHSELENGPVEIVEIYPFKMVIFSIVFPKKHGCFSMIYPWKMVIFHGFPKKHGCFSMLYPWKMVIFHVFFVCLPGGSSSRTPPPGGPPCGASCDCRYFDPSRPGNIQLLRCKMGGQHDSVFPVTKWRNGFESDHIKLNFWWFPKQDIS